MTHDNVTDLILWKLYIEGVNVAKKSPPDPVMCDGDAYGDPLSLSRFELDFCRV